jgi:hypothetical protein
MNILRINFYELYQRHLCRHAQFGINLWHVLSVYGVYFSIYSLVAFGIRTLLPKFTPTELGLLLMLLSVPYLMILVRNTPASVMFLTLVSTALLIICAVLTPVIPFWLHLILIPAWHRVQLISHKRYTLHRDMSAFNGKYRKGKTLFVLLALYKLPILLQYLAFGRKDWVW